MSLKVFDGYRITNTDGFQSEYFQFLEHISKVKQAITDKGQELTNVLYAKRCVSLWDNLRCIDNSTDAYIDQETDLQTESAMFSIFSKIRSEITNAGMYSRHPETDFSFHIVLYPLPKRDEILVRLRSEHPDAYDHLILDSYPKLKKFGYNGGIDHHLAGVTEKDWNFRYDLWDLTTNEQNILGGLPQVITVIEDDNSPILHCETNKFLDHQPSQEDRVRKISTSLLMNSWLDVFGGEFDPNIISQKFLKFIDWLKTDVGQHKLHEQEKVVGQILPHRYTQEDLNKRLATFRKPDAEDYRLDLSDMKNSVEPQT